MISFWALRSNPNLKQNALKDYKDLLRFEWEETKLDETKRLYEMSKGIFKDKLDG